MTAYEYVREVFDKRLPCMSTLRNYYAVTDCRPGFTKDAFTALKMMTEDNKKKLKKTVVHVVLDEMYIKKRIEYVNDRVYGYVDLGTSAGARDQDDDSQLQAKGVFVIMAVALNGCWKVPLSYFAISSMSGKERANLLGLVLIQLHNTGVICCFVTFDGEPANTTMVHELGANLEYSTSRYQLWFHHPAANNRVWVYPDPSHMIKLVRNTFGEKSPLIDELGRIIHFKYIVQLHEKQKQEGLHAGNKISERHVNYSVENKQKVKLAVQVLSNSVSCALYFLRDIDPKFRNVGPTAFFCKIFNDAFDTLNCRNLLSFKGFKRPLNASTEDKLKERAPEIQEYIERLKFEDDTLLYESGRKRDFIGFLACLDVVFQIYKQVKE